MQLRPAYGEVSAGGSEADGQLAPGRCGVARRATAGSGQACRLRTGLPSEDGLAVRGRWDGKGGLTPFFGGRQQQAGKGGCTARHCGAAGKPYGTARVRRLTRGVAVGLRKAGGLHQEQHQEQRQQ